MFSTKSLRLATLKNARLVHISAAPPRVSSILQSLTGASQFDETPLNQPFPGSVQNFPSEHVPDSAVKLSTLENGMRVVSLDADYASAHVGVHIDSGSRYEDASNHGISHFLEGHAFKSTSNRSAFRYVRETQKLGVSVGVVSTRDHTSYSADVLRGHLPHTLGGIADCLANSEFLRHELPESKDLYSELHIEPRADAPDQLEAIHAAAFKNNTYGNPLYASKAGLEQFTTEALVAHTKKFWTPDRMVVSAVGVQHSALVQMCNEYFAILPAASQVVAEKANYTGGDLRASSGDGLTHFTMGFEAPNWLSNDIVPVLVLQTLMGGGGAFSAGGPGKGMMTRLYRNVLNGQPWVINAKCDAHIYNDAGLFTISGDCLPGDAEALVGVLVRETQAMTGPVADQELSRAKNMLKSSILLALESRQVKQSDLGQQISTFGHVIGVNEWVSKIEAVTSADIQRVAGALLSTPLSVATTGDVSRVPNHAAVASFFN